MKNEDVKIAIIGSCVCRDIFRVAEENHMSNYDNYKIVKFYQFSNPYVYMMNSPERFMDISLLDGMKCSNFKKKCVVADYNKTSLKEIINSDAEWCIFDLTEFRFDIRETNLYGKKVYVTDTRNYRDVESFLFPNLIEDKKKIEITQDDRKQAVKDLLEVLSLRFGKKIIMVKNYLAAEFFDDINCTYLIDNEQYSFKVNEMLEELYTYVEENFLIHSIDLSKNHVSNINHLWGKDRLHFFDQYYLCIFKYIQTLISGISDTYDSEFYKSYLKLLYKNMDLKCKLSELNDDISMKTVTNNTLSKWNMIGTQGNEYTSDHVLVNKSGYCIISNTYCLSSDVKNICFSVRMKCIGSVDALAYIQIGVIKEGAFRHIETKNCIVDKEYKRKYISVSGVDLNELTIRIYTTTKCCIQLDHDILEKTKYPLLSD